MLPETLKKKAFSQHQKTKKRLRKYAHVLFFAPILIRTVRTRTAYTKLKSRGVPQYGEKGWRTDEVGGPDTHL